MFKSFSKSLSKMTEKGKSNIINIYMPKNNAFFISIIAIFIAFSIVLYFKPELFVFAFHSILGNIMMFIVLAVIGFFDKNLSIGLGLLLLVVYLSYRIGLNIGTSPNVKEGFDIGSNNNYKPWSPELIEDFKEFQTSRNPNIQYDINIVQKQATEDEVKELLQTGKWPWSERIQQLYLRAVAGSSNISMDPGIALTDAQNIYNENAIKELLAWSSKEGSFLLNGVIIGHPEGLPDNINNLARCGTGKDGSSVMQKIEYLGYNGINATMDKKVTDVANSDIPNIVKGFSFINGDCNPCAPLNDEADYSCPFKINTGNGTDVSDIWKILWGLATGTKNKTNSNQKNEFPVLTQLRKELNKAHSEDFHFMDGHNDDSVMNKNTVDAISDSQYDILQNNDADSSPEIGNDDYDIWVPPLEGGRY